MNKKDQINELVDYLEVTTNIFNNFEKYSIFSIDVSDRETRVHINSRSFFSFWDGEELTIKEIEGQNLDDDPITKNISFYKGEVKFNALFSKFEFQKFQEKMNSLQ